MFRDPALFETPPTGPGSPGRERRQIGPLAPVTDGGPLVHTDTAGAPERRADAGDDVVYAKHADARDRLAAFRDAQTSPEPE